MSPTISTPQPSDPLRSSEYPRPTPAKAGLPSDRIGPSLNAVVWLALVAHYGSVKAAAISLGDVDPSLLRRDIADGKFGRIEHADDDTKAAIATALYAAFGNNDPKARALRAIREARQKLDEIAEAIA